MHALARGLSVLLASLLTLLVVSVTGAASASASVSAGNDYPYKAQSDQSAADPWGFTERQCVSFVAWRLKQHGHALDNATQSWGSAYTWDDAARRMGVKMGTKPVVGAIVQWNAGEQSGWYANGSSQVNGTVTAGAYGHVAYVEKVYTDGSVLVSQYNMGSERAYSTMRIKRISSPHGTNRYIYYGVTAPR